ncbi:ABC-type glycerol-3-phosphate transport system permease component [Thermocatellispora tengchongensis]|uniref:ABC-type glycerol-3-phosphate transport system permease component n=1 Tax=Thermocatellispora tengchongensis TaxID=1073253 RepID=A0A840PN27_9ACTN|nr:carbohydrate ABC transporter permease [Thermocatellispora tengchongensis]MBB5139191.1 ABC-type glycerol-3-phosphate transport system permease component [Thermocatellispora tengchongensis]
MDETAPVGERGGIARRAGGHIMLGLLGLLCVFPIYWLYATSLRAPQDVYELSVLPWPLSLDSYADAMAKNDVAGMLLNTAIVAVLSALGQLLIGLLAAYAFAAWRFPLQRPLYLLFVGTWLVPFQATMLPNYALLGQLGLLETLAGVIIPTLCSTLGVLLLREHLMSFPKELLDAARMDGRSAWGILWTVVVPTLRPVLAALGILLAITAWNEYFWPAMVLQRSNAVIQLGLRSFMGTEGNDWGPLMATAGLACLPVFALYLFLQRHIVNAFVRSGLK